MLRTAATVRQACPAPPNETMVDRRGGPSGPLFSYPKMLAAPAKHPALASVRKRWVPKSRRRQRSKKKCLLHSPNRMTGSNPYGVMTKGVPPENVEFLGIAA